MKTMNPRTILATVILCASAFGTAVIAQTTPECSSETVNGCPKAGTVSSNTGGTKEKAPDTTAGSATSKSGEKPAAAPKKSTSEPANEAEPAIAATDTEPQQQAPTDEAQALAKKLSNPVASLISLPFQNNFDFGMGPNQDGVRYTLNIQPVIPISLGKDWNLISRTILPVIAQRDVVGTSSQFGLGDTNQSFFFSPNKAEPFIWGFGPQFLIPTGTDKYLGTQKFGMGLTGLVLKQTGRWTVGALVNHMWSVAGKDTRADVSLTYAQPFISYTTKTAWTFTANTETTYDWNGKEWNIPFHLTAAKLIRMGKQPVSIGGGVRCWAHSAPGGPRWCGIRFIFTPLFPKK